MSNKDRYDLQLRSVVNALSRSIIDAADEEIQEDARLADVDLDANAAHLRQMFADTSTRFRKRKFVEAQKAYEKEVQSLQHSVFNMPSSPSERLALLQLVAARHAEAGRPSLTAKFRNFENLSDSDVASLLEELAALGLIPDTKS